MSPMAAFWLWALLTLIVVAVYAHFVLSIRTPAEGDDYYKAIGQLRRPLFVFLALLLLISFALSVPRLPYPRGQIPDKVVYVTAKQFAFAITEKPVRTDEEFEAATTAEPIKVPMNALIEFRVTSRDVNHGFSLYAPDGELLGQTQAMPGYVNRLFMRFDRPGTYLALCLEYCGIAHHQMRGVFEVVAQKAVGVKGSDWQLANGERQADGQ
jgi:cytochrome c oxidase subunit 2